MDRHFDDGVTGILDLLDHFKRNGAGGRFERDVIKDRSAHQAKVAIDIADRETEGQFDEVLVSQTDDDAMKRIASFDFVAVHHVDAIADLLGQLKQFAGIVLCVAVGVEDPVFAGSGKAGAQHTTVATGSIVVDHAQLRKRAGHFLKDASRVVAAAIVDHNHFIIAGDLRKRLQSPQDHGWDRARVIVTGKESGNAGQSHENVEYLMRNAQRSTLVSVEVVEELIMVHSF